MIKNRLTYSIILIVTIVLASACTKDKEASEIPFIELKELQQFGSDSLVFTVHFIDGDGDIGLFDSDTLAPYNQDFEAGDPLFIFNTIDGIQLIPDSQNINGFTISMSYFAFEDGEWNNPDLRPFTLYRIKSITPDGQNKFLEGDLTYGLSLPDINSQNAWVRDSMKFEILLKDRTLNSSNIVETPLIIIE